MRQYLPLFTLMLFVSCQPGQDSKSITSGNVIQGGDDRTNISQVDSKLQKTAGAIATIIKKDQVIDNKDGTFTIKSVAAETDLCPEEKFKGAFKYGVCTAFKIGPNAIGTAGHCIEIGEGVKKFCEDYKLVFNFNDAGSKDGTTVGDRVVSAAQVVTCSEIAYYSANASRGGDDFAILLAEMDSSLPSLEVSDREVNIKDKVVKVGHGYGYLSNSSLGKVTKSDKYTLASTNDIFGGDSGSPLLDAESHEVVGVMVRASRAHSEFRVFDGTRSCFIEPKTKNEEVGMVTTMKASTILVPAMKSIVYADLVEKAFSEPTVANLEQVQKEIDPNLHFSIFTGESGVSFMSAIFQIHKFSVPLLNQLSAFVSEELYTDFLYLGKMRSQSFAEAVYDKFSEKVEYYDGESAGAIVEVIPDTRLTHHLNKYEDDELADLAMTMYQMKLPSLTKVIAYKHGVIAFMKRADNRWISVWHLMNHTKLKDGKVVAETDADKAAYAYDLSILKSYYGFKNDDKLMDENGLTDVALNKVLAGPGVFANYLMSLLAWELEQSKITTPKS